ncbi:MAG: cyclopropane-fatty-acyl-phospholipid synthase family protein [Gammaproteobacteria bacterium]|nr:cyclopropane-fatty-acyl-phospholipid synthase family protein [Gammaproteobacteria bacterium]
MTRSIVPLPSNLIAEQNTGLLTRFARKLVHNQLSKITKGEIVVRDNHSEYYFGKVSEDFPVRVYIDVMHPSIYLDVAFGGSPGSGEAYMKGSWQCSDLLGLVRIFLRNRDVLDTMDYGLTRLKAPIHKMLHVFSRNTRSGSKKNISAHYDIGNDLFKLFLDDTMMYSSAYYKSQDMTLAQAAVAKLDLVCQKLDLKPNDHLLEIGTGWGGLALHAAQRYGCTVTTTTISEEQYQMASEKIRTHGLQDKINVIKQDYRDLTGNYDKLVSIEMIEAIGHQYMKTYFQKCCSLLKPDGVMLIQAITIKDQLYKTALKDVDFIKKYIFPGGFLPSIAAMSESISRYTDMKLYHLQDIGPHYARTLKDWRVRFFARLDDIRKLGYPDEFIRLWEYYFCYCEGGFMERDIGTVQMVLTKPQNRLEPVIL